MSGANASALDRIRIWLMAVDFMVDVQYGMSQREDLTVLFTEATPRRALYSLTSLPGVELSILQELKIDLQYQRSVLLALDPRHRHILADLSFCVSDSALSSHSRLLK